MTDFDVEYESIYSTTVTPISQKLNRQKSIKKQQTQTIVFKVAKHTGDYFNVCCSSLDTLQNLYSKIEKTITVGYSCGLLNEYSTEITDHVICDKVHDLFIPSVSTKKILSIPNSDQILLIDYVNSHPDHFIPDKNLKIFKTYAIYLVNNETVDYLKTRKSNTSYLDSVLRELHRHTSCFNSKFNREQKIIEELNHTVQIYRQPHP
jgi:hypothetical protein